MYERSWQWPIMSSVFGLNQQVGCLIWRSHSVLNGFHWLGHCIDIFKVMPSFIFPPPINVLFTFWAWHSPWSPSGFFQIKYKCSLLCMYKIKLMSHMLLPLTPKHSTHSRKCFDLLECDSKHTQLKSITAAVQSLIQTHLPPLSLQHICYGLRL